MVSKMEKFTQKSYEELRATLSELHMHPGIVIYKDDSGNEIISKLYDWFINNSFQLILILIEKSPKLNDIFLNIYYNVEKIKNSNLPEDQVKIRILQLKNYFDEIETAKVALDITDEDLKKQIVKLFAFLSVLNDSKITIRELIDKINRYNIQVDNASKDLNNQKTEALADIDNNRKDFKKSIEDYKKDITETNEELKKELKKQYDDLDTNHKNFKKKIYKDLNDIQNAVNREQLAAYFLNERKKLKGDIDIPVLIYTVLFEIFIFFITDTFTEFWHDFTLLKLIIFLVGIFIAILPFVKWGYYKFFEPETKNDVKPFDEIKAILTPYWCWLSLTFLGMFSIFTRAEEFYTENMLEILKLKPFLFLGNLPFFMILVWFTWFCSKQFSYTKQICDEYEYKYALSKSYLSYRDEAKNIALNDEDKGKYEAVIVSLLDSVIKNIATSPVKSVKPDCHTPFTEVFGSLKDVMKHTENKE